MKTAWLFAENERPDRIILALSPAHNLNFLWKKFIGEYAVTVIYDKFHPGNMDQRFEARDRWRAAREIDGMPFDTYKEIYRRIDGSHRQNLLCGAERGLGRKNVFEYTYYGQETVREPVINSTHLGEECFYHPQLAQEKRVLIAPYAKCQGNRVFTFEFWAAVVHKLIDAGIPVTLNHSAGFCEDLYGNPLFQRIYPEPEELQREICRHKVVACGNTGVGWLAAACGVPLLAMQPPDSHIQDYRYEWCGVKSLIDFIEVPDADLVAGRLREFVDQTVVLTTGCYDILHKGHIRHLQESRSLGTKLIVALNSDASTRRLKGDGRPVHNQADRMEVLQALDCVDEVVVFDGDDASDIIHKLKPSIITNGSDHKIDEIVGKAFVESYGGRVHVTSGERTVSTSKTIAKIGQTASLSQNKAADVLRALRDGAAVSVNPHHKLKLMADQLMSVLTFDGDVADLGAYRGGTTIVLRRLAPNKNLHVFDTWSGNPYDDPDCHHKRGEWKADLSECKRLVGEDPMTMYHAGIFPENTADLKELAFAFVMVDCDTYQATKAAIEFFWPRIVPGGKMMFDDCPDWPPCAGVEKAVREFFSADQLQLFQHEHECVVTKELKDQ